MPRLWDAEFEGKVRRWANSFTVTLKCDRQVDDSGGKNAYRRIDSLT
jgi:hypothetical protein